MSLTHKQEKFAQHVAKGDTQSDAYRSAYSTDNMKDDTVNNNAYKLMQHNDISTRIVELKAQFAEKVEKKLNITVETLIQDLQKAKGWSEDAFDTNNFRGSVMDQAKLLGFLTGKGENNIEIKIDAARSSVIDRFMKRNKEK